MIHTIKRINIIIIAIIISMACITVTSSAATITKRVINKHLISIPEKPLIITITVRTTATYDGTYTDKSGKRTFTKHKETVSFSSPNDPYLVKKLKPSIGYLQFNTPSKKCNHIKCNCSHLKGSPIFSIKHYCSNTRITCKKGAATYCKGGYLISGGSNIVSKTVKYKNLAK